MNSKFFANQLNKQEQLNTLCCSADSEGVKKILENNPIDVNYDQGAPLIFAIRSIQVYPPPSQEKCRATIEVLIKAGADIHINDDAPLYWALKLNNQAAVNYLLANRDNEPFHIEEDLIKEYISKNINLGEEVKDQLEKAKTSVIDQTPQ